MVQIKVSHTAKVFRSIFEVLKDLLCDVNIYFKKTGFHIQSIDPEKMSIITLDIAGCKLVDYSFDSEEEMVPFGIHAPLFYKMLRSVGSTDVMEWVCNGEHMILSIRDINSWVSQTVTIPNIIIPVDEYKVMGGTGVEFDITVKEFRKALKETNYLTKKAKIEINNSGHILLIADGEGLARSRYHLRWSLPDPTHIVPLTKEFYHRGLEKILKLGIATSATVTMAPGTDPIQVKLHFDCGQLEMFVAVIQNE